MVPVTDGPLIVQSDKTLLLEVDHDLAGECRRAIAPFAELERAPEHVHTYRLTPLGLWNARAAGHDAEQVVDALLRVQPLPGAARAARRRRRDDGALRAAAAGEAPRRTAWCCATTDRAGARGGAARRRRSHRWSASASTRTPSPCTPPSAATSSRCCSSSAGRPRTSPATSTARRTRSRCAEDGWALRPYQQRGRRGLLARRLRRGRAALRRRQDARRRGRDGRRPQATTLILVTNTVSARQWRHELLQAHVADRGRDRRVLRRRARRSGRSPSRRTR